MNQAIRIVTIPAGEGHVSQRRPYVNCRFRLADPAPAEPVQPEGFGSDETPTEETYAVEFDEVLAGLRGANEYEWADYLAGVALKPAYVHFPKSCAELIEP